MSQSYNVVAEITIEREAGREDEDKISAVLDFATNCNPNLVPFILVFLRNT